MGPLAEDLIRSIRANDNEKIADILDTVNNQGKYNELANTTVFEQLLKTQKNTKILSATAEIIAELAKHEVNRKDLTSDGIIQPLLSNLSIKNADLCKQACRALCNICFDNGEARTLIGVDGFQTLMDLMKNCSDQADAQLLTATSGCLRNLLMDNDCLQKTAVNCKSLQLIEAVLNKNIKVADEFENSFMFIHVLHILNQLIEHLDTDEWISDSFCCTLVDLLKVSDSSEVWFLCLEVLHAQAQNDDIKILLAKKGVCELIFELVEKYKNDIDDEDSRASLRTTCDFIVLILTGDESMNFLYSNGKGKLYQNMLTWLDSKDVDLLSTGVLAIGNFARNDDRCIQMVQDGIAGKLLAILSKNNTPDNDVKVQHALLSAIRNLVIPEKNKALILKIGLFDILLPMLNIEHSPVVFKLLATLRIVIDGQEAAALHLITYKELIEKAVYWCYNSDHLGVRGESSRLLTWLIKHCHSTKPFQQLIETENCVKCLVEMMTSNHAVMQNESLIALVLLFSEPMNLRNVNMVGKISTVLIEADIGKNLHFLLTKYKSEIAKETVLNILSLLKLFTSCTEIVAHLKQSKVHEALNDLLHNQNLHEIHQSIKDAANTIDSG